MSALSFSHHFLRRLDLKGPEDQTDVEKTWGKMGKNRQMTMPLISSVAPHLSMSERSALPACLSPAADIILI